MAPCVHRCLDQLQWMDVACEPWELQALLRLARLTLPTPPPSQAAPLPTEHGGDAALASNGAVLQATENKEEDRRALLELLSLLPSVLGSRQAGGGGGAASSSAAASSVPAAVVPDLVRLFLHPALLADP